MFIITIYSFFLILWSFIQLLFLGEPKTSTDTPKWVDHSADSGTYNNNGDSTIGGVRSLYILLGAVAAVIGAIVLLIFFTVCMYSKRSSAHSNTPGKINVIIY